MATNRARATSKNARRAGIACIDLWTLLNYRALSSSKQSETKMPDRTTDNVRMSAPVRYADHALKRFVERWGPIPKAKQVLNTATCTGAYFIETIPDENQSIWGFVVHGGPRKGETALMVVSADGTVRTVLPSGSKRPTTRRRPPPATKRRSRR